VFALLRIVLGTLLATIPVTLGGPRVAGDAAIPPPTADTRRIVAECDRVVVARAGKLRECEWNGETRGATDPTSIRVAELVVEDAWWASSYERIRVRIGPDCSPPQGSAVWGLEPARGLQVEEWRERGIPQGVPLPAPLWQRRASRGSPWSM
jgi:hypothetical protein